MPYPYRELLEEPEPLSNEQCVSVIHTGTLSAFTWRKYLLANSNWESFTEGLTEKKLLIICGAHGGEDGHIGDVPHNGMDCSRQIVSLTSNYIFLQTTKLSVHPFGGYTNPQF